jgi:hypothetical protein
VRGEVIDQGSRGSGNFGDPVIPPGNSDHGSGEG